MWAGIIICLVGIFFLGLAGYQLWGTNRYTRFIIKKGTDNVFSPLASWSSYIGVVLLVVFGIGSIILGISCFM